MSIAWHETGHPSVRGNGAPSGRLGEGEPSSIGRYQVLHLLGAGSCANVYACHDPLLDRPVAVKILHSSLTEEQRKAVLERFRVELRVFGRVNHPHVVGVFDACLEGDRPYLVMELCSGPTLSTWRARAGRIPPGQAALIFHQASLALDHIHSLGILHRDIKPANCLFHHKVLKLTDFGVAQAAFIETGPEKHLVGTPAYMSPEQLAGETVTPRSDLFSLAALLFELLTGKPPLSGDPTSVLYQQAYDRIPSASNEAPDLPPDFDDFFAKALARDPAARFSSAAEMCAALSRIVPEHELEDIMGAVGTAQTVAPPPPVSYGYGQVPKAAAAYVSSRPPREPPPPVIPSSARIGGAVPPPWLRTGSRPAGEPDILEFDGSITLASGPVKTRGQAAPSSPSREPESAAWMAAKGLAEASAQPRRSGEERVKRRLSERALWLVPVAAGALVALGTWWKLEPPGHATSGEGASMAASAGAPRSVTAALKAPAGTEAAASALQGAERALAGRSFVLELDVVGQPTTAHLAGVLNSEGLAWRSVRVEPAGQGRYRIEFAPSSSAEAQPALERVASDLTLPGSLPVGASP